MADTGSSCSAAPAITARAAAPLVCGGATVSASPSTIDTGSRNEASCSGAKARMIAGANRNTARTPGMARASLAWDIHGDSSADAAAATRASIVCVAASC